jgi:hypothetical protein
MAKEKPAAKQKREYSDTEREFHDAENRLGDRLVEFLGVKRDILKRADDPDLRTLSRCFAEHAIENRNLSKRNRQLENELHSEDARTERATAKIARAAGARANIAAQAVAALAEMLPAAKAQAKKGKPALLRMILRATR